ncbi:hypothetical protein OG252_12160 [Streptomyces sp. NBC_01352]|nr:hypothetical protein [Streptomyces sp. NBC_01352]
MAPAHRARDPHGFGSTEEDCADVGRQESLADRPVLRRKQLTGLS